MANAVELVKKAAIEAVIKEQPCGIYYGTVLSIKPLKVDIEQRLTLEASQLILSSLVRDFTVDMVVNHQTEETEDHRHDYKGTKLFVVKLGLKENENVILIRTQGGQKFLILDRVR